MGAWVKINEGWYKRIDDVDRLEPGAHPDGETLAGELADDVVSTPE